MADPEKKSDDQTETAAAPTPAPANTLTARLALGPTPTLAPAVSPLAPANTNVPPNAGALAQLYGASAKPAPAPAPALGPGPAPAPAPAPAEEVEPPSDMQVIAQEMRASRKRMEDEINDRRKERDKTIKDAQDRMDQISKSYLAKDQTLDLKEGRMGERPKYKPLPVPEPKKTSLAEQWGSAAMIFAMLGSFMTRNHTVTALNAATAAMKGFQEGDKDATATAMKQWEASTTNMKMAYESEAKVYDDIMAGIRDARKNNKEVTKEQMDEAKALMTTAATAFKDDALLMAKNEGGLERMEMLNLTRQLTMERLEDSKEKANERREKAAAAKKIADAKNTPEFKKAVLAGDTTTMDRILAAAGDPTAEARMSNQDAKIKAAEVRGMGKKVTPETANEMKNQWTSLSRKPPLTWEKKDPEVNRAWTEALKEHPNLEQDYARRNEMYKNMTSGKDAATMRSFETVANHLDTLRRAIQEMPNENNVRAMNEWRAKWKTQIAGDPSITNFEAIRQVIPTELQKAVSGAGVGTGHERQTYADLLTRSGSKRQLLGVVANFEKLIEGQAISFADQYGRFFTIDQVFPPSTVSKVEEAIKKRDADTGVKTWPTSEYQQKGKTAQEVIDRTITRPTNVSESAKAFENGNIKIWWDGTHAYDYNTGQPVDPATGKPVQ
jgi:hypothetical protein